MTALIHPRTRMRPVGYRKNGYPIWPVRGADGTVTDPATELIEKRETAFSRLDELSTRFIAGETLTEAEVVERSTLEADIDALDARLDAVELQRSRVEKAAEARKKLGLGGQPANDPGGNVTVVSEPHLYREGGQHSYMMDLVRMGFGPGVNGFDSAVQRLKKHAKEISVDAREAEDKAKAGSATRSQQYLIRQTMEVINNRKDDNGIHNRDLSTAAGSGGEFVPPAYLTQKYVPYARPGRVFADACSQEDLPGGTMSLNIPKVTSGTTVDTQGAQNSNISDTDLETAFITFPVVTAAGGQILSLQLLERSPIAFDEITFKDLMLALAAKVDYKCLVGPGSGDVTGALNTTGLGVANAALPWNTADGGYVGGIKGLYGRLAYAKGNIASSRFVPATHVFMTPDRWEWIEQTVDSNNRPLILPAQNMPYNAAQIAPSDPVAEGSTGGRMLSLNVEQDFNIPANTGAGTNQDTILVCKPDDFWLFEAPVVARALPQTLGAQLSVLLQVYEYMAFTAARYPVSIQPITGTAITNPVAFNE
ncbi:MAG TPA: phage major capsid protein [Acidothermaceae bacterium]